MLIQFGHAVQCSLTSPGELARWPLGGDLIQTTDLPVPVLEKRVEARLDALPQGRGHDWSALGQIRERCDNGAGFVSAAIGTQGRAYERAKSRASNRRTVGAAGGVVPEASISRAARSGASGSR